MGWLSVVALLAPVFASDVHGASTNTLLKQAYDDMYNLQFKDAHRLLAQYRQQYPEDPFGPVSDAPAFLFSEFDRLPILQSEFFMDDAKVLNSKHNPDPSVKTRFLQDLSKTEQLANARTNNPGKRGNTIVAQTLRLGLDADYLASIEKQDLAAFSSMLGCY